jgi:NAD(P)-dependent dehydrogenase (short-subunit alcohol dehydrogenase family)
VHGFTEGLRHELAGSNIKVSVVHPGGIKTNIANHAKPGGGADRVAADRNRAIFNKATRTSPEEAINAVIADTHFLSLLAELYQYQVSLIILALLLC